MSAPVDNSSVLGYSGGFCVLPCLFFVLLVVLFSFIFIFSSKRTIYSLHYCGFSFWLCSVSDLAMGLRVSVHGGSQWRERASQWRAQSRYNNLRE